MQALPAAQAVSHYRASRAKNPATHDKTFDTYQDWYKADLIGSIKRAAQTKSVNLAQSQHITLEEAQSLVAQHPAHLLSIHRPLVRTALHIPPDSTVALRNVKVVHRVPTNMWSVIRWQYYN
ncbi:hypothetical protein T492DRAFT_898960 [Pavlovales sp. CCMP2436]|nr:hypothetical protein T492DRAFT_898960 [Pavlovales sp. CCMP2436]